MNVPTDIPRRILLEAHQIVEKLPAMLTSRKLTPAFSNFFLTSYGKMILFIAVLDTTQIGDHISYIHPDLLHQLSTDLGGRKVYLSNSTGLRFVIPLSSLPKLPKSIELPSDIPAGGVALGVRLGGQVIFIPWSRLGHLLIAGMTGSGKSSLLRSIAFRIKPSSAIMAKKIGCSNAHRIPANRPGLAIADRFGPMQSYYVPKSMFLAAGVSAQDALSELEEKLFTRAWVESEGKLTILNIAEWGECSQHQARKMQATWAIRGWIAKDGNRDNSFCLTAKAMNLVTNPQTQQTSSNRREPAQTQSIGESK